MANYMRPPMLEGKFELIADNMPAAARIAYCFKCRQINYLIELSLDYACDDLARALPSNSVDLDLLDDLYQEITQERGVRRTLIKALRAVNNITVARSGTGGTSFTVSNYLPQHFEAQI